MSRLNTSQTKVARDCGMSSSSALSNWLNGTYKCAPGTICAGAKAMQWYESNKSKESAPQQPLPPEETKGAKGKFSVPVSYNVND